MPAVFATAIAMRKKCRSPARSDSSAANSDPTPSSGSSSRTGAKASEKGCPPDHAAQRFEQALPDGEVAGGVSEEDRLRVRREEAVLDAEGGGEKENDDGRPRAGHRGSGVTRTQGDGASATRIPRGRRWSSVSPPQVRVRAETPSFAGARPIWNRSIGCATVPLRVSGTRSDLVGLDVLVAVEARPHRVRHRGRRGGRRSS